LLLKFVFSATTPPEQLDRALKRHGEDLQVRRQEYRERLSSPQIFSLARSEREALLWRLSLENGLSWCDAQINWVARARRELSAVPATRSRPSKKKRS